MTFFEPFGFIHPKNPSVPVALDSMIDAGRKHKLKTQALEERRAQLGQIPDWEVDMEAHPEIMLKKYRDSLPK